MNRTLLELEDNTPHYSTKPSRLQWLIILIPVAGASLLYILVRMYNRKRQLKCSIDEETPRAFPLPMRTNPIPTPAPIYSRNTRMPSQAPLVRLSDHNNLLWQLLQRTSNNLPHQNRQRQRRRRREHLNRALTPPPAYSACSPPCYEETDRDNETLAQVQSRLCNAS